MQINIPNTASNKIIKNRHKSIGNHDDNMKWWSINPLKRDVKLFITSYFKQFFLNTRCVWIWETANHKAPFSLQGAQSNYPKRRNLIDLQGDVSWESSAKHQSLHLAHCSHLDYFISVAMIRLHSNYLNPFSVIHYCCYCKILFLATGFMS